MSAKQYEDVSHNLIEQRIPTNNLILIVTATDLETKILHNNLSPTKGNDEVLRVLHKNLAYYYGKLGLYDVVHVQSSMGSLSRSSSIMTVNEALEFLKVKVVIMLGIAFGVDKKKQKIGDVLISESVIPYNPKRVGRKMTIARGIEAPASKHLLSRFKTLTATWHHLVDNNSEAETFPTRLLSGEELIDNLAHRNQIISINPDSRGGEMEGAGIYASCDGRAEWILVKGICDFADGKKGLNKQLRQEIAMRSAISAALEVFNSPYAFQELNITPVATQSPIVINFNIDLDKILFDIYDKSKESYYIERTVDTQFKNVLSQSGIWIFGPSGSGKSNLIIRNLVDQNKKFVTINLAGCSSDEMIGFFKEIYFSLLEYLDLSATEFPDNFNDALKKILILISKHFDSQDLIILIEEIPIGHDMAYKEFSTKIFQFILSKNLVSGLEKVKIVLSSINSPTNHIQSYQQKIHNQLRFVGLKYWELDEINKLIEVIEGASHFILPSEVKKLLISKSQGSPRFIKKFFRDIFALRIAEESELLVQINETFRELNLYQND